MPSLCGFLETNALVYRTLIWKPGNIYYLILRFVLGALRYPKGNRMSVIISRCQQTVDHFTGTVFSQFGFNGIERGRCFNAPDILATGGTRNKRSGQAGIVTSAQFDARTIQRCPY